MFRSFLGFLAVSLIALVGDPGHLWRLWTCLLAGAAATIAIYWLSQAVVPLWPGFATMAAAAAAGAFWEGRAQKAADRMLQ